jgi:hypothetical protein
MWKRFLILRLRLFFNLQGGKKCRGRKGKEGLVAHLCKYLLILWFQSHNSNHWSLHYIVLIHNLGPLKKIKNQTVKLNTQHLKQPNCDGQFMNWLNWFIQFVNCPARERIIWLYANMYLILTDRGIVCGGCAA